MAAAASRGPTTSRAKGVPAGWAVLVIAFAVATPVLLVAAGPTPATGSPTSLQLSSTERPGCAALETNASLDEGVGLFYPGLANLSRDWSPFQNTTRPVGPTAYLNESAVRTNLVEAWSGICGSDGFQEAFALAGSQNLTETQGLNGSSGHWEISFALAWYSTCAPPLNSSDGPCLTTETWGIDLVTWAILGPYTAQQGALGGIGPPGPPLLTFPLGLVNASNSSLGGRYVYRYAIELYNLFLFHGQLLVSDVALEVKTFDCGPVPALQAIELVAPSGAVLAEENLSTLGWAPSGSIAFSTLDTVQLVASAPLVGDEMILTSTSPAYSGSIGFVIAGSGAWAGCSP